MVSRLTSLLNTHSERQRANKNVVFSTRVEEPPSLLGGVFNSPRLFDILTIMDRARRRKEERERRKAERRQGASSQEIISLPPQPLLTRPLPVLLLIALLATAIYSNTFSASFHFDDTPNIVENPKIKQLSNFTDFSGSRYVGFLTFAFNYHLGGLHVFGYHLVNLLIHITNGFLVYSLVLLLFRASSPSHLSSRISYLTAAPWIALATALLFIAHPIQTQAVTYIVQRFASLAALFYLLAVVCYLKWRLSQPSTLNPSTSLRTGFQLSTSSLWYAGALLSTLLAMKTKEISFTLPFMILLVEAVFFRLHQLSTLNFQLRLLPFLLTLPLIPLSHVDAVGEAEGFARETTEISRLDYLFTQFRVIMTYLRLLFFPIHQNLDYDYPIYHSWFHPAVFFSFLFLLCLFALGVYLLVHSSQFMVHSHPLPSPPPSRGREGWGGSQLIAFGILWFFLTLSVESSLIPIRDVIFEHRLYLPSAGFFLTVVVAAAMGLQNLKTKLHGKGFLSFIYNPIPITLSLLLILLFLSSATYQRNRVWQDELMLWTDVVAKSPKKERAYNALGVYHQSQGSIKEAIQAYKTALMFNLNYFQPYNNLGNLYREQGKIEEAIREYQTALGFKNDFADAHHNLGIAYADLGRLDEAITQYQAALRLKPQSAEAHNSLGDAYRLQGRVEEAIQKFQTALRLDPDLSKAYNNLGLVYQAQGKIQEAIQAYEKALELEPGNPGTLLNLGRAHADQGQLEKAYLVFQDVLKQKPNYDKAYFELGNLYFNQGKWEEAVQSYLKAIELKAGNAEYHNNLGSAYFNLGRLEDSIKEYQMALKLKPDYAQVRKNLGVAYGRMGRFKEARRELEQALKIDPNYKAARELLESLPQ